MVWIRMQVNGRMWTRMHLMLVHAPQVHMFAKFHACNIKTTMSCTVHNNGGLFPRLRGVEFVAELLQDALT